MRFQIFGPTDLQISVNLDVEIFEHFQPRDCAPHQAHLVSTTCGPPHCQVHLSGTTSVSAVGQQRRVCGALWSVASRHAVRRGAWRCGGQQCMSVNNNVSHSNRPLPFPFCNRHNTPQQSAVVYPCPTHLATSLGWRGGHLRSPQRKLRGESEGTPHRHSVSCSSSCRGAPRGDVCRGCASGHVRRCVSRVCRGACDKKVRRGAPRGLSEYMRRVASRGLRRDVCRGASRSL